MRYDFTKMSNADVFKAKLAHDEIPFGFVPSWRMNRFVKFCLTHGLIYQPPNWMPDVYRVKHKFTYVCSLSKVRHLPLGRILEWIADIMFANDPNKFSALKCYVQRSVLQCHPAPRIVRGRIDVSYSEGILH